MANRFDQCDTVRDGKQCRGSPAYVYRNAFATRVVCDACAAEYEVNHTMGSVSELAIAEILPSRPALLARVEQARDAVDKYKAKIQVHQLEAKVIWQWSMVLVLLAFAAALPPAWWIVAFLGSIVGVCFASLRRWIWRYWTKPQLDEIDKLQGMPERFFENGGRP